MATTILVAGLLGMAPLAAQGRARRIAPAGSRSSEYFGRGFDLDQGADFALSVDGIPVNLPSALRGPGFLDYGFIIGETVADPIYRRGPYRDDQGAFAIAGSADLEPVDFGRPLAKLSYGGAAGDRFGRLLWADTVGGTRQVTYALEATRSYRPWNQWGPSSKLNAYLRVAPGHDEGTALTLLATQDRGDGGSFPLDRALPAGFEDEWGDLRVGDGYAYRRLFLGLRRDLDRSGGVSDRFRAYAGLSSLQDWANNTYYLRDQDWGDQVEAVDRRGFLGLEGRRQWELRLGEHEWSHRAGFQLRADQVTAAEIYASYDRERRAPLMLARGSLVHAAVYGQSTLRWGDGWQAFLAGRIDQQHNRSYGAQPRIAQTRTGTLVSPRLGLSYSPGPGTLVRAAWGQGFRLGNGFRDTRPMIRAQGGELSGQTRLAGAWDSSLTLWWLDLEHEAVFSPAEHALVLGDPSRRHGLEWFNGVAWGPWNLELCLAWSRARYRHPLAGADHVPGSLPQTGTLSVAWQDHGLKASLRLRSLGAYAVSADNRVVAGRQTCLELKLQRDWRDWSAAVKVLNAFNLRKNTQILYYESRLPMDLAPVPGTHSKHGDPQAIRLELSRRF